MKFFQRIRSVFTNNTTTEGSIDRILREVFGSTPSLAGESVTPNTAMRTATVYACVRVLSEAVAQVPLLLYRRDGDSKKRDSEHFASSLLNRLSNPWQTSFEFREMMMGHLCLRGNAYAYKAGEGQFMRLVPIHPDEMEVKRQIDGSIRYWRTSESGVKTEIPSAKILHIRGPFDGMSPIQAYKEAVGLSLATQKFQAKTFANGAKFRGYLKHPGKLSPDGGRKLRESFDEQHSGDNAMKTPLLEEGLDFIKVGMTAEDSAIIETQKMTRSEIASIFRVPVHMVNDLDRAHFNNIEHLSIQFVTTSLVPWFRRWELSLYRDLLTPAEREVYYFEHLAEGLLRGDTKSRFEAYGKAINDGWMSRNEVRERENLDRVDGLDEFLVPLNMAGSHQNEPTESDPNETQADQ